MSGAMGKAMVAAMRKRRAAVERTDMPGMDIRTGAPLDVDLGPKPDADLPDVQLPVYRGENQTPTRKPKFARR